MTDRSDVLGMAQDRAEKNRLAWLAAEEERDALRAVVGCLLDSMEATMSAVQHKRPDGVYTDLQVYCRYIDFIRRALLSQQPCAMRLLLKRLRHRLVLGRRHDDVTAGVCQYMIEWIDEVI